MFAALKQPAMMGQVLVQLVLDASKQEERLW